MASLNMSSLGANQQAPINQLMRWLPVIIGLMVLYVPTYLGLSSGLWQAEDQMHGPIILMVVIFLIWQKREFLINYLPPQQQSIIGWISLVLGLFCYVVGRSQDIMVLDIGSQILVLAGILLLIVGKQALKAMWFPLFFIIFMLPLPLDGITMPMKMAVSYVTENLLFWFNYPIARSGVVLHIGQYQLLVADACAGMHTLISLEALGLLYLNLVKSSSAFRNITLAILIIPISFAANVIRVIALTLITFYFGDAVGQGFVHGFAGMLLFFVALICIMSVDSSLQYFVKLRRRV